MPTLNDIATEVQKIAHAEICEHGPFHEPKIEIFIADNLHQSLLAEIEREYPHMLMEISKKETLLGFPYFVFRCHSPNVNPWYRIHVVRE